MFNTRGMGLLFTFIYDLPDFSGGTPSDGNIYIYIFLCIYIYIYFYIDTVNVPG